MATEVATAALPLGGVVGIESVKYGKHTLTENYRCSII